MSGLTKKTLHTRLFSDPKNYPYGFSRSGDFSIAESKALAQYGCLFAALVDGEYSPVDAEDEQYISSALGHSDPKTVQERAWLKYQKRINRPRCASIYGSAKSVANEDDIEVDADDSLDLDA
ncbi:DUF413 domain-containing protein [Agaribacter marinus]|uniref:Macrodomain Ori protein n=1 Tax=Agaribacter marinus TaxID=1431249 RepID=A0AA37T3M8_9ALTE|nr:DUF413 domain-containing protein [Agaribacter marinus]GLR72534.1 hypothetical protein GCM10007852_34420 [Agaribacter marinus]